MLLLWSWHFQNLVLDHLLQAACRSTLTGEAAAGLPHLSAQLAFSQKKKDEFGLGGVKHPSVLVLLSAQPAASIEDNEEQDPRVANNDFPLSGFSCSCPKPEPSLSSDFSLVNLS